MTKGNKMTTKQFVGNKTGTTSKNACKTVTKANKPQNPKAPVRQYEGRTK